MMIPNYFAHDPEGSSDEEDANVKQSLVIKKTTKKKGLKNTLSSFFGQQKREVERGVERQNSYQSTTTATSKTSTRKDLTEMMLDPRLDDSEQADHDDQIFHQVAASKIRHPETPSTVAAEESFESFNSDENSLNSKNAAVNPLETTLDDGKPEVYHDDDNSQAEGETVQLMKKDNSTEQSSSSSSSSSAALKTFDHSKSAETATESAAPLEIPPPTSEDLVAETNDDNDSKSDFTGSVGTLSDTESLAQEDEAAVALDAIQDLVDENNSTGGSDLSSIGTISDDDSLVKEMIAEETNVSSIGSNSSAEHAAITPMAAQENIIAANFIAELAGVVSVETDSIPSIAGSNDKASAMETTQPASTEPVPNPPRFLESLVLFATMGSINHKMPTDTDSEGYLSVPSLSSKSSLAKSASSTPPTDSDFVALNLKDEDAEDAVFEDVEASNTLHETKPLMSDPKIPLGSSLKDPIMVPSSNPWHGIYTIPHYQPAKSDALMKDAEGSMTCASSDFAGDDSEIGMVSDDDYDEVVQEKKKAPVQAASRSKSFKLVCLAIGFAALIATTLPFFVDVKSASAVITAAPSVSMAPSSTPSVSQIPSTSPSSSPSLTPSISNRPTITPSGQPTISSAPTSAPTKSAAPTPAPSILPTVSVEPTDVPSAVPSASPTSNPSVSPSLGPTVSKAPSSNPSSGPSPAPSTSPSQHPTVTFAPSKSPSRSPTRKPTRFPTPPPTRNPTPRPTPPPTRNPTPRPTPNPTRPPTPRPTPNPTKPPTPHPTREPTRQPTPRPTSPDLLSASKIRLYWSTDYFWQETKEETWWCMECVKCAEYGNLDAPDHGCVSYGSGDEAKCQAGDSLWIRDCRDRGNRFSIEEVGDGFMMRIATTNLCVERIRDQPPFLYIQNCDRNSSYQRFILQDDYNKFEMRPVLYRGRSEEQSECVSQLHHPKNGELLALHNCRLNRLYETAYWQRWWN